MLGTEQVMTSLIPTFDSPKVAKARLPIPLYSQIMGARTTFFDSDGDILDDRLVTCQIPPPEVVA